MDNRRAHPRYSTALSVEIYTEQKLILATANNLSVGGLGVISTEVIPDKTGVGLSMFLVEEGIEDETTPPLNLRGKVAWCAPVDAGGFQAGLQFETLTQPQQSAITHFLRRLRG